MKNQLRTYWWVVFLAVNFIPGKSIAAEKVALSSNWLGSKAADLQSSQQSISDRIRATYPDGKLPGEASTAPSVPPISGPGPIVPPAKVPAPAPAPQDPNTMYLSSSQISALIPGFGIADALDEDGNIVFNGTVPRICKDKVSVSPELHQTESVYVLSFKSAPSDLDPTKSAFETCVNACKSGKPSLGQCAKDSIAATISGDTDVTLTIGIATSADSYESTIWKLQSAGDALEEKLAWQAENCRGNEDQTFEQNMTDLLTAEDAISQLDKRGFFKKNEAFRDEQLAAIKDSRTEYQHERVAEFVAAVTEIESSGSQGADSVKALNDLRVSVKKFALANKGAVTGDVSDLYQKIASADLSLNANSYVDSKTYMATMSRARGDFAAAKKLKGLNTDSQIALKNFGDGLNLHQLTYLSNQGAGSAFMYANLSRNLRQQLEMDYNSSGCQNPSARMSNVSSGQVVPTALNSRCAYLTNARNYLGKVDSNEKQSLQAQQDHVRYQQETDIFNQIKQQQADEAQKIAQIQQQAVQTAQAATSQRSLALSAQNQPQRLPNGQIINNTGVIPPNGQVNPNGLNGMNMGVQPLQAPRPPMAAPQPLPTFDFFSGGPSVPTAGSSSMIGMNGS